MPCDGLVMEVTLLVPNVTKTTLRCTIALTVESLLLRAQTVTTHTKCWVSCSKDGKVTPVKEFKGSDYEALLKRKLSFEQQFHQKEITRFFFFSCQACVCQICIVKNNRKHEIVFLDKAAHDEKPNIMADTEIISKKLSLESSAVK